ATFTSGGTATVTDTWHALATVTATYTNPGTKVGNIQLDRFVSDLPVVAGGALRSTATMNPAGGTVTLSVTSPLASQAMMRTILSPCAINAPNCSATGSQLITQALDSSPSYALDIAAKTLPWLGTTIYDPTTTILTVPATGTGPIDIFEADLAYTRNNTVLHVWRVFGPNIMDIHFANLLALPGGESPIPCPGTPCTDVQGVHHARIGDSDAIGGYRPARQNVFDSLETCEQPEGSPTPPPGTPVRRYGGTVNRFMQSQ
ncbi:MAG: hypothetical protein JWO36_1715, partial [Myxococcales bacterium]|nr:hypothetical protein [Myxococcales bacterium]